MNEAIWVHRTWATEYVILVGGYRYCYRPSVQGVISDRQSLDVNSHPCSPQLQTLRQLHSILLLQTISPEVVLTLTVEEALPTDAAPGCNHPRLLSQRLVICTQLHGLAPPTQHCPAVPRIRHHQLITCFQHIRYSKTD